MYDSHAVEYVTFEGYFVPASNDTQIAIFSDDGVDAYLDDSLVFHRIDVGQHLPYGPSSFQVPPYQSWVAGQVYKVMIVYHNIIWQGPGDVDGCTMYACGDGTNGGGTVYDWVNIDTDSDNDDDIDDDDDPLDEASPGKYVEIGGSRAQADISFSPGNSALNGSKITLQASNTNISVYLSETGGSAISLPHTFTIGTDDPASVYVQAEQAGTALLEVVLGTPNATAVCSDKVKFAVVDYTTPVIERGLPTDNVNSQDADRSNIKWADSDPSVGYGDDFTLPTGQWIVDKITVWGIPTVPGYSSYALGDHFSSLTLYKGQLTGTLTVAKSGNLTVGSNTTSSDDVIVTSVHYPVSGSAPDYLRPDGGLDKLWQVEFKNLNWSVDGGTAHVFGVYGVPRVDRLWFNAASNYALSGWPTQTVDGYVRRFDVNNLSGTTVEDGSGWFAGKGSDINVQIFAHPQ